MAGLTDFDCEGTLTIGGISMNRLAWAVVGDERGRGGLLSLVTTVEQRGDDRILPSAAGVIPYQRRRTRTPHTLRLLVVGDVDLNGNANVDPLAGLVANLDYLHDNVVDVVNTATGTRAATLDLPGLAQRSADVHVTSLRHDQYVLIEGQPVWEGTLRISIPAGRFT